MHRGPCVEKVLVVASEEDEAGSHIGKAKLAEPFVVAQIAAAAAVDAAFSESLQGHVFAGRIEPVADTGTKLGPSSLLRCAVPTDDDPQVWTALSLLVERLPSVASRKTGIRLDLADALIQGEADSGRPVVRGKDA